MKFFSMFAVLAIILAGLACGKNSALPTAPSTIEKLSIAPALSAVKVNGAPARFQIHGGLVPYAVFYISGVGDFRLPDATHVEFWATGSGLFRFRVQSADGQHVEAGGGAFK